MNNSGMSRHDQVLAGLVMSLQAATMQHLGKIKNPLTDAVERDLDQARGTIDILEMLKAKCRQETPQEILDLLDAAVMQLQMNFLDEANRDQSDPAGESPETEEPPASGEDSPQKDDEA